MKNNRIVKSLFLIVCLLTIVLTGCGSKQVITVNKLEVVKDTIPTSEKVDFYSNNNFSMIQFTVTYSDNTNKTISLDSSMLSNEDVELFKVPGEHVIDVTYEGVTTSFVVNIIANDVETYNVTFHYWNGDVETVLIESGKRAQKPFYTQVENEQHFGWYKEGTFENLYDFNLPVEANIDLYEKISAKYKLSYFVEGNVIEESLVLEGETVTLHEAVVLEHATFVAWTNNGTQVSELKMPANDVVLVAKFDYTKYSVEFVFDNGSENNLNYYIVGEEIVKPADPIRPGYTFLGWDKEVPTTMNGESLVITALWEKRTYTVNYIIEFRRNDLVVSTNLHRTQTVEYNELIALPEYKTFVGYYFDSYELNGEVVSEAFNAPHADAINLVSVYQATAHKLTIELDGKQYVHEVLYGELVKDYLDQIDTFKYGHTFSGWYNGLYRVPSEFLMPASDVAIKGTNNPNPHKLVLIVDDVVVYNDIEFFGVSLESYNPTKEGHSFVKWVNVRGEEVKSMIDEDVTLYAVWDKSSYTVTINNNGVITSANYVYNTPVTFPTPNYVEGYTFVGWRVNGQVIDHNNYLTPGYNVHIESHYVVNSYEVNYTMNGVSATLANKVVYNTQFYSYLPTPVQITGYTFSHWAYTNTGETVNSSDLMPASSISVTAVYTLNYHNLTYIVEGVSETYTVHYGYDITSYQVSKLGYEFKGWYDENGNLCEAMPDYALTVYARFDIVSYKLTINNAGYISEELVEYNSVLSFPEAKEVEGYTFIGWALDGILVDTTNYRMPAHDLYFTARYSINNYVAVFVTNTNQELPDQSITFGGKVERPASLTKEGYTFVNWTLNGEVVDFDTFVVPATEVLVFVANWQINQYEVRFVLDNGEEDVVYTQDYGTTFETPADPELFGYMFDGWDVEIPATVPAYDVVITAKYNAIQYAITISVLAHEGDEAIPMDTVYFKYNEPVSITAPEYEGHTFIAWSKDIPTVMPAENFDIIAIYLVNTYTVRFIDNGVELTDYTQVLKYDTAITNIPADPEKDGFTFESWQCAELENTFIDVDFAAGKVKVPTSDLVFVSNYYRNMYNLSFEVELKYQNQDEYVKAENGTYRVSYDENISQYISDYSYAGWNDLRYYVDGELIDFETYKVPSRDVHITIKTEEHDYSYLQYEKISGYVVIKGVSDSYQGSELYIPSYIDGLEVQYIDSNAFRGNEHIKNVYIGYNLIHIGVNAFRDSSIESVLFDNRSKLDVVSQYAFADCENLTTINLPLTVTSIGSSAFSGCSKLALITLGSNVLSVGDRCFNGCSILIIHNYAEVTDNWANGWLGDATLVDKRN